jgi:purine-binding chemotaxis protein CheW
MNNLALDTKESRDTENEIKLLTFTVNNSEYAVDIMIVREIKGWNGVTRVPNSPPSMRGVMNLRGLIVPIFDLRTRFGLGATEATEKNVTIILSSGNKMIGMLVDTVSDILDTCIGEIKPAPNQAEIDDKYVTGLISVNDKMVILLDIDQLFSQEIFKEVNNNQPE